MNKFLYNLRGRIAGAIDPREPGLKLAIALAAQKLETANKLAKTFQPSNEVKEFMAKLEAKNFAPTGAHWLNDSRIITLSTQTQMIWIQLHKDGKLNRVFVEVNENNLETLADKLLQPPAYIDEAQNFINGALSALVAEFGDTLVRQAKPAPEYVERVEGMLQEGGRVLREVK